MRALKSIAGHVIYNPAYTYTFELETNHILFKVSYLDKKHQQDDLDSLFFECSLLKAFIHNLFHNLFHKIV